MKNHVSSFQFVRKMPFTPVILAAVSFAVAIFCGARVQAQTYESWTAIADNFTNGADWNPAITGSTTNWPNDNNGLGILYRPLLTNGGTIYYVGPTANDPYDPNWTNTVDQMSLGPSSGASPSSGTNTFIMTGGSLTFSDSGGADLAVGGYSVNSVSNNSVFTMTGGMLIDTNDAASSSDASLYVATGSNAPAIVNLDGGTANFNNVYISGRGIGTVNIDGADVNINGDSYGNSSSGGTPTYEIIIGYGTSGTVSANGKGAGTMNLMSGELDLTNGVGLVIGARCDSATLNVSGGELDTPEVQWGFNTSGKITNTFNFSGGLINIGAGGLKHLGTETNSLVLSGGIFSTLFGQSWSDDGSLSVTLTNAPGAGVATFAPSQDASITIRSVMSGPGALTATGPGEVALGGAETYTGATTLSGGTLAIEVYQPNLLNLNNTGGSIQIGPGLVGSADPLRDNPLSMPNYTSLIFSNTAAVAFTNVVTGDATLLIGGGGAVTNDAVNFQETGSTTINDGSLVLTGTGSSLVSPTITIGSGGTLDVSHLSSFNLGNGQGVNDSGSLVGGNINFESGSTLAFGLLATNIVLNGPQSGNLTLNSGSTNEVALNVTNFDAGNNQLVGFSSVTIGGTLMITNFGSPFVAGEVIPLYGAAAYSGNFSSIVPATPGSGLVWDTSQLDVSGTLRVISSGSNPNAPYIIQQPISTNVGAGLVISDTVVAGGNGLSYQWYQSPGGVPATGQTSAALTFNPTAPSNTGDYYLVVSNSYGVAVSAMISVTILPPTQITGQLPITYTNLSTFYAGANPKFSVTATGVFPLSYLWFTNGVLDSAATANILQMTNVQVGVFSNYCIVSNAVNSETSSVWAAQVIADPTNSANGLAPYPQAVLALNPIGYWRLNQPDNGNGNDGVVCLDYAGGNNGIYTNLSLAQTGYNPTTDPSDTSAQFGETDQNNDFGDSLVLGIAGINFASTNTSSAFTVEAWVSGYVQSYAGAGIVSLGWGGGGEQFCMDCGATSDAFRFFFRDAAGTSHVVNSTNVTTTIGGSFGPWYHLAGVVDEVHTNVTFYIDGQSVGSSALSPGIGVLSSAYLMNIGSRMSSQTTNYNDQLLGNINDVSVFNYALSAAQVASEYAVGGSLAPIFAPAPATNASAAANTTLTIPVTAIGTPPVSYLWTNLTTSATIVTGVTNAATLNASLVYGNVPAAWNGDQLELIVSNAYGSTNAFVTLTVPNINLNPTNIVFSVTNNQLYLNWPADHTGWQLQAQTNSLSAGISTNWVNVNSTTGTNQFVVPVNLTNGSVFYRLTYP